MLLTPEASIVLEVDPEASIGMLLTPEASIVLEVDLEASIVLLVSPGRYMVISLNGPVVQLVELWIVDPSVAGSNPVWSAKKQDRSMSGSCFLMYNYEFLTCLFSTTFKFEIN